MAKAVLDELTRDKGVLNQKNIIGGYHIVKNEEERLALNPGVLTLDGTTIVEEIDTKKKYQFTGKRAQNKIDNWTEIVEEKEKIPENPFNEEMMKKIITNDILDSKVKTLGYIDGSIDELARKENLNNLNLEIESKIATKANSSDVYTKEEMDEKFLKTENITDFVTKSVFNQKNFLSKSIGDEEYAKKEDIDGSLFIEKNELEVKANKSSLYNRTEKDNTFTKKEDIGNLKDDINLSIEELKRVRDEIVNVKLDIIDRGIKLPTDLLIDILPVQLTDQDGYVDEYYMIPKFRCEDIDPTGELGTGVHPAFIVNGGELPCIYMSRYEAGGRINGGPKVLSQEDKAQTLSVSQTNAKTLCSNKQYTIGGKTVNAHLPTNWDYAAMLLWLILKEGVKEYEGSNNTISRTGSDIRYSHNQTEKGIFDITGGTGEYVDKCTIVSSVIRIPNNNDLSASPVSTGVKFINNWSEYGLINNGQMGAAGDTLMKLRRALLVAPSCIGKVKGGVYLYNSSSVLHLIRGVVNNDFKGIGPLALTIRYGAATTSSYFGFRMCVHPPI